MAKKQIKTISKIFVNGVYSDASETQIADIENRKNSVREIRPHELLEERERRLAAGFDYDFGDDRGIHRIGTTRSDLQGWNEVSSIAQVALNADQSSFIISISTETGLCDVTASEWQNILLAAAAFRQPIFTGYFNLKKLEIIPVDYKDDSYWN